MPERFLTQGTTCAIAQSAFCRPRNATRNPTTGAYRDIGGVLVRFVQKDRALHKQCRDPKALHMCGAV